MKVSHVLSSPLVPSAGVRRGRHRGLGPWCAGGDQAQAGVLRALSCHLTVRNRWESQRAPFSWGQKASQVYFYLSSQQTSQICGTDAVTPYAMSAFQGNVSRAFWRENEQQGCWYGYVWVGRSWRRQTVLLLSTTSASAIAVNRWTQLLPDFSTP